MECNMRFHLPAYLFTWIVSLALVSHVGAQILKYPGDQCSTELRDNNLCVRNSACVQTGIHELNGDPKMQCMCDGGRIKDPQLWCSDCDDTRTGFECGANSVCTYIEAIDAKRCVCQGDTVRNHTANDGQCVTCEEGLLGFLSFCDRGMCSGGKCDCHTGYVRDPVNNTCVQCKDPWLPEIRCNETYANTSCYIDGLTGEHFCLCPLGLTFNENDECSECNDVTAPCRAQEKCIEGADRQNPETKHSFCYESCDIEDPSACNPRASQKLCTVGELDLGEGHNICRCQNGYVQLNDGTCVSALEQLNCFSCNHTESCIGRQSPENNFFDTCQIGDYCWTTANWYWNFDTRLWENITYRRECHSNPCKNADENFCMDNPYHKGHHICVTCCTTGLCNNKMLSPQVASASPLQAVLPLLSTLLTLVLLFV